MRLEDLNWMDVEAYLRRDQRLMLVLGACEEHGYLSLCSDVRIPQALADAASQRTGVPVAPALPFGVSPHFTAFPGTISLKLKTYLEVVGDIVRSLYGQGFRRILVVNGHGGNDPAQVALIELRNEIPDLRLEWVSWWEEAAIAEVAKRHGLGTEHASWMEAFTFTRVAPLPEGQKARVSLPGMAGAAEVRAAIGDGAFGGAYQADEAVMQELFEVGVQALLEALARLERG
jgi:creatinine amidohydrolase